MLWLVAQYLPPLYSFRHIIQFCFAQLVCRCQPAITRGHLNQIAGLIELSSPCHPYQETCAAVFTKTPPSAPSNQARRGIYIALYFLPALFHIPNCTVPGVCYLSGSPSNTGFGCIMCASQCCRPEQKTQPRQEYTHTVHICACIWEKKYTCFAGSMLCRMKG